MDWDDPERAVRQPDTWREEGKRLAAHAVSYKLALSGLQEMKLHIFISRLYTLFLWIQYYNKIKT